eukprot:403333283
MHPILINLCKNCHLWLSQIKLELCEPMIEKIHQQKDLLRQTNKIIVQQDERIQEMEYIVLNKGQKLDIFDKIYMKIAIEQQRKETELQMQQKLEEHTQKLNDLQFHMQSYDKTLENLNQHEDFISKMTLGQHQCLQQIEELREKTTQLDYNVNLKTQKISIHESNIQEIFERVSHAEAIVTELQVDTLKLSSQKLDRNLFDDEHIQVSRTLAEHTHQLLEVVNNAQTVDNYIEKYQQIRFQHQLTETLMSVLSQKERRRLEHYDSEKMALLYKCVLDDNSTLANIQRLITQLNERARREVEEEEKKRKRRNVGSENGGSQIDGSSIIGGGEIKKGFSGMNNTKGSHFRATGQMEDILSDESMDRDSDLEDNLNKHKKKMQTGKTSMNQTQKSKWTNNSKAHDDGFEYSLHQLIQADFNISEDDDDFELSHEQLIKVMKEISQFIHTLHSDFEGFLKKHKKEHAEISTKIREIEEKVKGDNFNSEIKNSIEHYATILSCLVEYSSIEQALCLQDENDRQKIQLIGQKSVLKGENLQKGFENSSFTGFGSITQNIALNSSSIKTAAQTQNTGAFNKSTYRSNIASIRFKNISTSQNEQDGLQSKRDNQSLAEDSIAVNQESQINTQRNVVDLDANCLSCTGQSSHVIQQFKMACLSYTPSLVKYRGDKFNRVSLMQMRQTLVQKCEEIVNELKWPFKERNLNTKKVFKDLVQYYQDQQNQNDPIKLIQNLDQMTKNTKRDKLNRSVVVNMNSAQQNYQNKGINNLEVSRNQPQHARNQTITLTGSFIANSQTPNTTTALNLRKASENDTNTIKLFKMRQNQLQQQFSTINQALNLTTTSNKKYSRQQQERESKHNQLQNMTESQILMDELRQVEESRNSSQQQKRFTSLHVNTHTLNLPKINLLQQ